MLTQGLAHRLTVTAILTLMCSCAHPAPPGAQPTPALVLWAWDRAEDFRFLQPGEAEVAGLMATIQLRDGHAEPWYRRLALVVPDGVPLTAVVRLESDGTALPPADEVANTIAYAARHPGVVGLQIDFDARESQRSWYTDLLAKLGAHRQPAPYRLSITALASWCLEPPWFTRDFRRVPEAVPMLFRMGPERGPLIDRVMHEGLHEDCAGSIGLSLDEPLAKRPPASRIYIFNPQRWTPESFAQARALLH